LVTHQDFYRAERRGQLSQGDIVVAPTVMAWSPESRPAPDIFPQIVADLGSSVLSPAWSPDPPRNIPSVTTETRWGPAIVLSHDCSIDKEFNEKVDRLIHAEGLAERDAVRAASEDRTLDPYIVVSPLYDYARLPANKRESVRSGQRYGFFPLPSLPGFQKPRPPPTPHRRTLSVGRRRQSCISKGPRRPRTPVQDRRRVRFETLAVGGKGRPGRCSGRVLGRGSSQVGRLARVASRRSWAPWAQGYERSTFLAVAWSRTHITDGPRVASPMGHGTHKLPRGLGAPLTVLQAMPSGPPRTRLQEASHTALQKNDDRDPVVCCSL